MKTNTLAQIACSQIAKISKLIVTIVGLLFALTVIDANVVSAGPVQAAAAKQLMSLGKVAAADASLAALLDNHAFFETLTAPADRTERFAKILELIQDDENVIRGRELKSLLDVQLQALNKTPHDTTVQDSLAKLFVLQLDAIAGTEADQLAIFEVSALSVINETFFINIDHQSALAQAANSEFARLTESISQSPDNGLNHYAMAIEKVAKSPRVVGAMELDVVTANPETGSSSSRKAFSALKKVIDVRDLPGLMKALGQMRSDIATRAADEKKAFVLKVKQNPTFLINILMSLGTSVAGVYLMQPGMIGGGLFGLFGDSVMKRIPLNRMFAAIAKAAKSLRHVKSPEEQAAVLKEMKSEIESASPETLTRALACGTMAGSRCDELLNAELSEPNGWAAVQVDANTADGIEGLVANSAQRCHVTVATPGNNQAVDSDAQLETVNPLFSSKASRFTKSIAAQSLRSGTACMRFLSGR